jgi:hypothetical protein
VVPGNKETSDTRNAIEIRHEQTAFEINFVKTKKKKKKQSNGDDEYFHNYDHDYVQIKQLRWSRGTVLAFGTQVRGVRTRPKPPSFGGEVKPSVPCLSFTACKRSLNVTWKSDISRPCGDMRGVAWWRKLERLTQIAQ